MQQDSFSGKSENTAQKGLTIIGNWLAQVIEKAAGGITSGLAGCQRMEQWNGHTRLSVLSPASS